MDVEKGGGAGSGGANTAEWFSLQGKSHRVISLLLAMCQQSNIGIQFNFPVWLFCVVFPFLFLFSTYFYHLFCSFVAHFLVSHSFTFVSFFTLQRELQLFPDATFRMRAFHLRYANRVHDDSHSPFTIHNIISLWLFVHPGAKYADMLLLQPSPALGATKNGSKEPQHVGAGCTKTIRKMQRAYFVPTILVSVISRRWRIIIALSFIECLCSRVWLEFCAHRLPLRRIRAIFNLHQTKLISCRITNPISMRPEYTNTHSFHWMRCERQSQTADLNSLPNSRTIKKTILIF